MSKTTLLLLKHNGVIRIYIRWAKHNQVWFMYRYKGIGVDLLFFNL